ncbi:hypothetical protein D3C72_2204810 [compost metagenome]
MCVHKGAVRWRRSDLETVSHDETGFQIGFVLNLGVGAQSGIEGSQRFRFWVVGQVGGVFDGEVGHGGSGQWGAPVCGAGRTARAVPV